ncbi:MAG: B12-binding domain-containing radical SAM protein [Syntrophobacteria bacterium]
MASNIKRVLLLHTDRYYLVKQVYPFGLDLIANYLRNCGYEVTIDYPFLPEADPAVNLANILKRSNPQVIGIGIRNLDTCMSCEQYGDHEGPGYKTFYFFPDVERIVEIIKELQPEIPMVVGGGAFSVAPAAILKRLGIQYGIVGQGEEPLRQFLEAYPDNKTIAKIPNMVLQIGDGHLESTKRYYTFSEIGGVVDRARKFTYAHETAGLPVQVKRGCNQNCCYCVEPLIEGRRFVFKDYDNAVGELQEVADNNEEIRSIFFVDTEFNLPDLRYCSALVERIIDAGLHEHFCFCSQFLPKPFEPEFARLLAEAGFDVIFTCDSLADGVLERNGSSHRRKDVIKALELCEQFGINCTVALIFGLPGETYETIDQTVEDVLRYPPNVLRRYEYTVGGRIYQGTPLCRFVETHQCDQHLYGKRSEGYLEPYYYCCPENPWQLNGYLERVLPFSMTYRNNYDDTSRQALALAYLADQGRWDEAEARFLHSGLGAQTSIYDYIFRKLADSGKTDVARILSEGLIHRILASEDSSKYAEQLAVIRYYLSLLTTSS